MAKKFIASKSLPYVTTKKLFPSQLNVEISNSRNRHHSRACSESEDNHSLALTATTMESKQRSVLPPKEFHIAFPSEWKSLALQLGFICLIFLAVFGLLYLSRNVLYPLSQNAGNLPYFDCTYSGTFSFQGIDVPFGSMDFAQAKSIDLVFNLVFGRGLQSIVAWVCYRLFNEVLMHITESHRLSYRLFGALALAPTQMHSLIPTSKTLLSKLPYGAKFQLFWLLLTTTYLVLFPTLIDSLSGYQALQTTEFLLPNGTSLSQLSKSAPNELSGILDLFSAMLFNPSEPLIYKFAPPNGTISNMSFAYIFHSEGWATPQASRVGVVGFPAEVNFTAAFPWNTGSNYALLLSPGNLTYITRCINTTHSQVYTNPWIGDEVSSTSGQMPSPIELAIYDDPSCDNWFYLQGEFSSSSAFFDWDGTAMDSVKYPFLQSFNAGYFNDKSNYQCISFGNLQYQWGFSYEFFLIFSCVNGFWLIGTYLIYLHASHRSQLICKGRKFGIWRAVLDLAEALQEDLGTQTSAYGEDELQAEIEKLDEEGWGVEYSVTRGTVGLEEDENKGSGKGRRLGLTSFGSDAKVRLLLGVKYE